MIPDSHIRAFGEMRYGKVMPEILHPELKVERKEQEQESVKNIKEAVSKNETPDILSKKSKKEGIRPPKFPLILQNRVKVPLNRVDPLKWVKIPLKINKSSLLIINTLRVAQNRPS